MNFSSTLVDDLEKTVDDREYEDYLIKFYENNSDRINKIQKAIEISELTGIVSALIFLIVVAIRVNTTTFQFSWFYLLIPAVICLISFTFSLNMYLKLKSVFDEAEKIRDDEDTSNIGSVVTLFCLNSISLNILIYLILFCFKSEGLIQTQWNVISIPLYIFLGISVFYSIFIFPAFIQNKLYWEILMIYVYLISTFTFMLLLNYKLDDNNKIKYLIVFVPLILAIGFHLIYLLVQVFKVKEELFKILSTLLLVLFILIAIVLTIVKADNISNKYGYWLPVFFMIIGFVIFISEKIASLIFEKNEEEMETQKGKI